MINKFIEINCCYEIRQSCCACYIHNNRLGFVPFMNILFWGQQYFSITYSKRDILGNVWNCVLGSPMVDTGILSYNMKSLSPECYMIFCKWPYVVTRSITLFCDVVTLRDVITELREVSMVHLQQLWHVSRGCFLLLTPGSGPFGTFICSNVKISISKTCHVLHIEFQISLGTSILPIIQILLFLDKITVITYHS